jgi:uncharacterized protein
MKAITFWEHHRMKQHHDVNKVSRRTFAALSGTAAISPLLAQNTQQTPPAKPSAPPPRRGTMPEIPPFQAPIEFARKDVRAKVRPFPMTQVRIRGGIYLDALEWNRGYMGRLGGDRLVRNFLLNAGLPSSAKPLGGWESYGPGRACELRGHFTGHFLSASGLMYASTGDKDVKAKADDMVDELAKCQRKLDLGGYLSAFPTEWFDRLDARQPVWAPFYTIHKIMAGMLDMYQHAGNRQALEVLEGMANWTDHWTATKTEEHMQDILNTEFGGMQEVLYNLAAVTNNDRWARTGDRFTKKIFFNPLALRRDELRGLHVNTHIPQVIGGARRYEISGDMRFHDVADYFWYDVTGARTYVTGGTSNGEGWLTEPRHLAAELKRSVATAECCCAYNMLKLTRHLYSWTGDPRYFDYYERTLMNHRIGTIHPESGHTQYYLSLMPGVWKTFCTEDQSFWCCTGTGVEEYSKLNNSIYWHDDDGLFVNLFIPSELNWKERGFRLRQDTKFPQEPKTTLAIQVDGPLRMPIRLRIPEWLGEGGAVKVNGRPVDAFASPGSYLTLVRTWNDGDRIEIDLPMRLHMEKMPDDETIQAAMYGPVVLAGDFGSNGLDPEMITGPNAPQLWREPALDVPSAEFVPARTIPPHRNRPERHIAAVDIPTLKSGGAGPDAWIKPGDQPLTFRADGQPKDIALKPLNSIFGERYTVYWKVS